MYNFLSNLVYLMLQRLSDKKKKLFLIQSPEQTNTRHIIKLHACNLQVFLHEKKVAIRYK